MTDMENCENCKFWEHDGYEGPDHGDCSKVNTRDLMSVGDKGMAYVHISEICNASLCTHREFYCSSWEDKEEGIEPAMMTPPIVGRRVHHRGYGQIGEVKEVKDGGLVVDFSGYLKEKFVSKENCTLLSDELD